jgi:hypothetical protein
MRHRICLLVSGIVLCLVSVQPAQAATEIWTTTITANTTWGPSGSPPDSVYLIQVDVTIQSSARLTIQPGTTLRFAQNKRLQIASGTPGSLSAIGTAAEPITFTGDVAAPGYWDGLLFKDFSDGGGASSELSHCLIECGGGPDTGALVRCEYTTTPVMADCILRHSSNRGLYLRTSSLTVTGSTIEDCAGYPVDLPPTTVGPIVRSNTIVPNQAGTFNAILVQAGAIDTSVTWPTPAAGLCYLIVEDADISIQGTADPVLTLLPGTVVKSRGTTMLNVGTYNGENGGLRATGVLFTSAYDDTVCDATGNGPTSPAPGDWQNVTFWERAVDSESVLDDSVFRYGGIPDGNTHGVVAIRGSQPTVARCLLDRNDYSLGVESADQQPFVTQCTIRNFRSYALYLHPMAVESVVRPEGGNALVPNADGKRNTICIVAGTLNTSETWPVPPAGYTYRIKGDIDVSNATGPVLTLSPGTVVKIDPEIGLAIGSYNESGGGPPGGLRATGVLFTSSKDDTLGDALGDGPIPPNPGDWQNVIFWANALPSESVLDGCTFRYGGYWGHPYYHGTVVAYGAQPTVRDCLFDDNAYSFCVETGTPQPYVTDCTFRNFHACALYLHPMAVEGVLRSEAGNVLIPNADGTHNSIRVRGGTIAESTTWPVPPTPFTYGVEADDDITIAGTADPVLRLLPGTIIKQQGGTAWNVGQYNGESGGLRATGVLFTSSKDDTLGDALGDGPIPPNPGDWQNVIFCDRALDGESVLEDCTLRYGGYNGHPYWHGVIYATGASPTVTRCRVDHALRAGMYFIGAGEAPVVLESSVTACERGIRCSTGPGTVINYCDIWGNSLAGVENLGGSLINAELNWWGAADGPSGDGPGSGDAVFGPVDYTPWLTQPYNGSIPAFEVISARSDTTLYQNGVDTALITVVTRSNWGHGNALTLALTLRPSLGPLMPVGDDYFALAPGEQHESHFAWQVPDTSYAWEFGADLLLTKDSREEVLRQYVPGVFEATPLEKEIVIQATLHVAGCSAGIPPEFSDCAVRFQRGLPAYSELYSIGLFEQYSCRVMDLYLHDRPVEGLAVYQAMLPEFAKFLAIEALSWLTGGIQELSFIIKAADLFHSGNEYIRNCASTAFAEELVAYGKGRPFSDPDELLDSLAVIMNTAIDSTDGELADLLFVDGVPHVVVLADSTRADADSTGLIMAVVNHVDSLVTLTSVTPHVHRFRGRETDNPHSNAVLAIYPQVARSVHVGLLHATIANERLYFRYPAIAATDGTIISLPVADNLTQLPLYIDFDGDGTVDEVQYPVAESAVEEVRTPPPFFAVPSPNPASDGTVISFAIPRRGQVIIRAFDLLGRCVGVLFDGPCEAGSHRFVWNGHDAARRPMTSGVYFLRLECGGQLATRRLVVLR